MTNLRQCLHFPCRNQSGASEIPANLFLQGHAETTALEAEKGGRLLEARTTAWHPEQASTCERANSGTTAVLLHSESQKSEDGKISESQKSEKAVDNDRVFMPL